MSTLLVQLKGHRLLNKTFFPPYLYVYDDLLMYKKRKWFALTEATISYNQVARFTTTKMLFYSHVSLATTSGDVIDIRFVNKKAASRAKSVIDQKIYHAIAKHETPISVQPNDISVQEKSINRLKELLNRGKISEKEYENKKKDILG